MSPGFSAFLGLTWPPPMSKGSAALRVGPSSIISVPSVPVWEAALQIQNDHYFDHEWNDQSKHNNAKTYSPEVTRADFMAAGDQVGWADLMSAAIPVT